MADQLFDRRLGVVLGLYVGDVLGLPYEGTQRPVPITYEDLVMMPCRDFRIGSWSDDTEMACAIMKELAEFGDVEADSMARRFAAEAVCGGYSRRTTFYLSLIRAGHSRADAVSLVYPEEGSRGNGASMRVGPLAAHLYDSPQRLKKQVIEASTATHTHQHAIDGAQAVAAAVAAALRGETTEGIFQAAVEAATDDEFRGALLRVEEALAEGWDPATTAEQLGNGLLALQSTPGSIYAALQAESFADAYVFAIGMGGDTDTQAAIAGSICGARFGASALERRWTDNLRPSQRVQLERLSRQLWA